MAVVPDLGEGCSVLAAPEVWKCANLGLEGVLDLGQRVGSLVRGSDTVGSQHIIGGVSLETTEER